MSIAHSDPDELDERVRSLIAWLRLERAHYEAELAQEPYCSHSPLGSHHATCPHCYKHWACDRIDAAIECLENGTRVRG